MTKRVKAGSHSNNPKPFAYDLKITKKISLSDLSAMLRTKDKTVAVGGEMTVKELAQLNAHWYESLLIALSFDKKRKRVEILLVVFALFRELRVDLIALAEESVAFAGARFDLFRGTLARMEQRGGGFVPLRSQLLELAKLGKRLLEGLITTAKIDVEPLVRFLLGHRSQAS